VNKRFAGSAAIMAIGAICFAGALQAQPPAAQDAGRGRGTPPPPAAPPPGSAGTYLNGDDLQAALKKAIGGAGGEMSSSLVVNNDQYRSSIVHREKAAGAIAHAGWTELHYVIEGAGTIVTGGKIVRAQGAGAGDATIEGGETRRMKKGDVIIVPANSAHWYKAVEGSITYLEVRFIAPAR
jgi:mannose-6-phosphate isomerase-like protein (cupin superfamily)